MREFHAESVRVGMSANDQGRGTLVMVVKHDTCMNSRLLPVRQYYGLIVCGYMYTRLAVIFFFFFANY